MMYLVGYTLLNEGNGGKDYDYFSQVHSQEDIEIHRKLINNIHPDKEVVFHTKQKLVNGKKIITA